MHENHTNPNVCHVCGGKIKCIETRVRKDIIFNAFPVRRRKECLECGQRFTTYELRHSTLIKIMEETDNVSSNEGRDIKELKLSLYPMLEVIVGKKPANSQ